MRPNLYKLFSLITISIFVALKLQTLALATTYSMGDFIPGSRCPKPESEGVVSVCGTLRSSDLDESPYKDITDKPNKLVGEPVEGVYVFVYECDPGEPTCKRGDSLVHPYSWTKTNKNGQFYLKSRKVGGAQIRYLVVACRTTNSTDTSKAEFYIDGIHKFPSYHNLPDFVDYVSCQGEAAGTINYSSNNRVTIEATGDTEIAAPPEQLRIIPSPEVALACSSNAGEVSRGMSGVRETNSANESATEATFNERVKGFDPRFTPAKYTGDGIEINKVPDGWASLFLGNPSPGGFWSKNCGELQTSGDAVHCPDSGTNPDDYEYELYTQGYAEDKDRPYVVQIYNAGIPPKSVLLAPRETTFRADYTSMSQDPFRVSQFVLSSFGACLDADENGKSIGYGKYLENKSTQFIKCETLKKCNVAYSRGSEDYKNMLTTTGPGRAMAPRYIVRELYNYYLAENGVLDDVVCTLSDDPTDTSNLVTMGEVQPWWDYNSCTPGEAGCKYKIGAEYFDPYLIMIATGKSATTFKSSVFNVPEASFKPRPEDSPRDKKYVVGDDETAGDGYKASQAGTRTVIPGSTKDADGNRVLSAASSSYTLLTAAATKDVPKLTDAPYDINLSELFALRYQEPSKDAKTKKLMLTGDFTLINYGNEITNYCNNSVQNGTAPTDVNSLNEAAQNVDNVVKMNGKEGVDAHYPKGSEVGYGETIPPDNGSATGVSQVIYSSAALNRNDKIKDLYTFADPSNILSGSNVFYLFKAKVRAFDAALNVSVGRGEVNLDEMSLASIIKAFLVPGDADVNNKVFFAKDVSGTPSIAMARDDFLVKYDRIETDYGKYEAVSEESFQKFFPFPDKSSDLNTVENSAYYPFPWESAWGDNYCYPWGSGIGLTDNNPPKVSGGGDIEEKFGSIIKVTNYCGVTSKRPLLFTKKLDIDVGNTAWINGRRDNEYPDQNQFSIANTCRQIQCKTNQRQGNGTDCTSKYERAWCAEQQLTTIKDNIRCEYKSNSPGTDGRNSLCDNAYLKANPGNSANCAYDEIEFNNCNGTEPGKLPVCCLDSDVKKSYKNPCDVTDTTNYWVCLTRDDQVAQKVDQWLFCTVQVAGPFGAQGRLKQCDGTAEFSSTVDIVPQNFAEADSQINPQEASQVAENLVYRLFRPRFTPNDKVCYDQPGATGCREADYRYRSGAMDNVAASVIVKKFKDDEGEEISRDTAGIEKEAPGASYDNKEQFAYVRENYTSTSDYENPQTCGTGTGTSSADFGWDCETKPVPADIKLSSLGGGCSFNPNTEACKALIFNTDAYGTPNLSQTFIKVLQAAGKQFEVPPSLLLAAMKVGGGFDEYRHYWTDEEIPDLGITNEDILIHDPYNDFIGTEPWYSWLPMGYRNNKIYTCSNTDGGKQGAFKMWKLYYDREMNRIVDNDRFGGYTPSMTAYDALEALSSGRGDVAKEIRCNFLHSAYVAAAGLRNEVNKWSNEYAEPSPTTCSKSTWSDWDRVGKALRYLQYAFVLDTDAARNQDLFAPYEAGGLGQNIMNACE